MAGTDVEMDLLDELRRLRRNQVQENQQLQTRIQELENLVYSNGGGSTGASKQSGGEIVEKVDEFRILKRENYNLKLRLGLAEFPGRTYDKDKIAKAEAHAAYVLEYERKKSNIFGENKTDDDEAAKKVLVAKEGEETNMTKEMMEEANKKKQKKGLFKKVAHGHSGVWCFCCKGKGLLFCCTFSNKIRPSPSESGRPPLISTPSEYLDRQLSAGKQEGTGNSFQNSQLPYRPMKEVLNNPDGSKFKKSNIPKSFAGKKWSPPAEHTNQHDFVWTSYDVEFGPGPLGMKLNIHPDAKGCFVHHVEPGSQADMAKVTVNEKISTVGGVKISGAHDAMAELKKQSRPVLLTFLRPSLKEQPRRPSAKRSNSWRGDIEIPNMTEILKRNSNGAVASTSERSAGNKTGSSPRLTLEEEQAPKKAKSILGISTIDTNDLPTGNNAKKIITRSEMDQKLSPDRDNMRNGLIGSSKNNGDDDNERPLDSTLNVLMRKNVSPQEVTESYLRAGTKQQHTLNSSVIDGSEKEKDKAENIARKIREAQKRTEKGGSDDDSLLSSSSSEEEDMEEEMEEEEEELRIAPRRKKSKNSRRKKSSSRRKKSKNARRRRSRQASSSSSNSDMSSDDDENLKILKLKKKKRDDSESRTRLANIKKKRAASVASIKASSLNIAPSPKRLTWKEKMELRKQQAMKDFDDEEEDV
jgi:hypothetical protein